MLNAGGRCISGFTRNVPLQELENTKKIIEDAGWVVGSVTKEDYLPEGWVTIDTFSYCIGRCRCFGGWEDCNCEFPQEPQISFVDEMNQILTQEG